MKITRISRMQDCGVFHDFRWRDDANLVDFGKFNLIYGWNGSGKSTISRIFRSLELRKAPALGHITVDLDGRPIDGAMFPTIPARDIAVRVFNQDYVRANVFPVNGGDLAPIVVVGEKNVKAQKEIVELNDKLDQLRQSEVTMRAQLDDAKRQFDAHSPPAARDIKDKVGGDATSAYRNYNRADYEKRADQMIRDGGPAAHILAPDDRSMLDARQREPQRSNLVVRQYDEPDFAALAADTSRVLSTAVPSVRAIQTLLDNPALEQWIRRGIADHMDETHDECPFCGQSLPPSRLHELNDHFNDERERLVQKINDLLAQLEQVETAATKLPEHIPHEDSLYSDLRSQYADASAVLSTYAQDVQNFVAEQTQQLKRKTARLHESMGITASAAVPTGGPLSQFVAIVDKHNTVCKTHASAIADARSRLEADYVANHLGEYKRITTRIETAKESLASTEQQAKQIQARIDELVRDSLDHGPAADLLNEDLRNYLGHEQLQLDVREHGYVIMRDGVPAQNPSEGEMTAIALLYFLRSLEDKDFDLEESVVVLDDPVSSLDANALYVASGFIRSRTAYAGQLFVLTHNFTFFREVRDWFWYLNKRKWGSPEKQQARLYMLQRGARAEQPQSRITELDHLLRDYESEYHYLFSRVYRATASADESLEQRYDLPNVCRRLLEGFLAFRRPQSRGETFRSRLAVAEPDIVRRERIYRFVNAYSHNNAISAPEHDPYPLGEISSVLKHVLELIERLDEEHYRGLVELSDQVSAQSTAE